MFCVNCGSPMPEGANFCPQCRKPLNENPPQAAAPETNAGFGVQGVNQQAPPPPAAPYQPPFVQQPPAQPYMPGVQPYMPNVVPPRANSKFRWPTFGCLLGAGVLGLIIAFTFLADGLSGLSSRGYFINQQSLIFTGVGVWLILSAILFILGGTLAIKRVAAMVLGIIGCLVLFLLFAQVFTVLPLPAFVAYFTVLVLGLLGTVFSVIQVARK